MIYAILVLFLVVIRVLCSNKFFLACPLMLVVGTGDVYPLIISNTWNYDLSFVIIIFLKILLMGCGNTSISY